MRQFITEGRKQILWASILYALIGIALLIFNVSFLSTIILFAGWILVIFAAYNLYVFFIRRDALSVGPLLLAIPFLVLGYFCIRYPRDVIGMTSMIIGFVLIFNGIAHIQSALVLKDLRYVHWVYSLIYSICIAIIGVILLFDPIQTVSTVLKICGVLLIIQAVSMFIDQYRIKKLVKDVDNANNVVEGDYTEVDDE